MSKRNEYIRILKLAEVGLLTKDELLQGEQRTYRITLNLTGIPSVRKPGVKLITLNLNTPDAYDPVSDRTQKLYRY
jgi:hypothetical protein